MRSCESIVLNNLQHSMCLGHNDSCFVSQIIFGTKSKQTRLEILHGKISLIVLVFDHTSPRLARLANIVASLNFDKTPLRLDIFSNSIIRKCFWDSRETLSHYWTLLYYRLTQLCVFSYSCGSPHTAHTILGG
jgi:hypothetical protein